MIVETHGNALLFMAHGHIMQKNQKLHLRISCLKPKTKLIIVTTFVAGGLGALKILLLSIRSVSMM